MYMILLVSHINYHYIDELYTHLYNMKRHYKQWWSSILL